MLSILRRNASGAARAGVTVGDDAIALALVERAGDDVRLKHFSVAEERGEDWLGGANEVASGAELRRVPATAVVGDNAYQLVLVECPQVPAEETAAAVRWRIRDLIGFSADDAVIDTFPMPDLANQGGRPMLYAVAAEGKSVERLVDAVRGAGLSLDTIDIPEMCLRNVAVRLPEEARGVAFLHFEKEHGTVLVSRAGVLYMIRRIDVGMRAIYALATEEPAVDVTSDVALEVQRSLDYFESHYDQRPIMDLVLGPGTPVTFAQMLGEQLGVNVSVLDLNAIVASDARIPDAQQAQMLVAVGAALRSEEAAA